MIAIAAIFRDEAAHLCEWIAFHYLQGVTHFRLYDNRSSDDWRSALSVFNGRRELRIQVVRWDYAPPCQLPAYHDAALALAGKAEWVAFIDVDEFLWSAQGLTLGQVLANYPEAAVAANWVVFGSSGHKVRPADLTVSAYTLRMPLSTSVNRHVKTIARPESVVHVRNPHFFDLRGSTVGTDHVPFRGPFNGPLHDVLRINHYRSRSHQEYALKAAKGRVDLPPGHIEQLNPDDCKIYDGDIPDTALRDLCEKPLKHLLARWEVKNAAPVSQPTPGLKRPTG